MTLNYIMFYYWKSGYLLGYSLICNQNNETFKYPSQSQLLNVQLESKVSKPELMQRESVELIEDRSDISFKNACIKFIMKSVHMF